MAKEMLGRVPTDAYISDPIASQYGIQHIWAISSAVVGHWSLENEMLGSIGIASGLASEKFNRAKIESM